MPTAHSRFGGSIASRYLACPGSVALCATVPAKPSGVQADLGTAAHALAEECLKTSTDAADHRGEFFPRKEDQPDRKKAFIVEDDMIAAVQIYLDTVRAEEASSPSAELYVEKGFVIDVPTAEPGEVFGTNDAMVYHPSTGRLRVFDYKHGKGVSVTADDNAQLKFYALGAVFANPDWRLSEVVLTIVQPRALDADDVGKVKDWTFDVIDLLEFQGELEKGIGDAKQPGAKLCTGPHCRWCDAASACPAKQAEILDQAGLDFQDVTLVTVDDLPDPKTFDTAQLGKILKAGELLNSWLNQVQEYVEALVLGGTPVPGWKAVEKIGRARWIDDPVEAATYAELLFSLDADQTMPRKLVTITEMDKLLKAAGATKEQIEDFKLKFTLKESSGLTIAPESDRRPAVNAVERDFGSVKLDG